jgi:hypothetical protein
MAMVERKFVTILEFRGSVLPIRVYPCASVVNRFQFRETLRFTTTSPNAKMVQQQLARIS